MADWSITNIIFVTCLCGISSAALVPGYTRGVPSGYWYYKLHTDLKTWYEAKLVCESENAQLAVINSQEEADIYVREVANKGPREVIEGKFRRGIPEWQLDIVALGFYEKFENGRYNQTYFTIDGAPLHESGFYRWAGGQPDHGETEHCGSMFRNGELNDLPCDEPFMFMCETTFPFTNDDISENEPKCALFDKGYKLGATIGDRMYKFHPEPKTWDHASLVCQSEGAKLAVINSDEEARIYVAAMEEHPQSSIRGNFNKGVALLGFHNRFNNRDFVTMDGSPIHSTGYTRWSAGQPVISYKEEQCGGMNRNGLLNGLSCDAKFMFFCEKLASYNSTSLLAKGVCTDFSRKPLSYGDIVRDLECNIYEQDKNERQNIKYRRDYIYIEEYLKFIKINEKRKSWHEAKNYCQAEGASIAVIRTQSEAIAIRNILKTFSLSSQEVWVGLHDIVSEGEFETIKGESIADVYGAWEVGQPSDISDHKNCVIFGDKGLLKNELCNIRYPFLCEKDALSIKRNGACDNYDMEYQSVLSGTQCIKFHTIPKTWEDAYVTCNAEESHLAIINSQDEAELYKTEFSKYPSQKLNGNFNKDVILLGFHDKITSGDYVTVDGTRLTKTGYTFWGQKEKSVGENCGVMRRDATLGVISCNVKAMFICEKQIQK